MKSFLSLTITIFPSSNKKLLRLYNANNNLILQLTGNKKSICLKSKNRLSNKLVEVILGLNRTLKTQIKTSIKCVSQSVH